MTDKPEGPALAARVAELRGFILRATDDDSGERCWITRTRRGGDPVEDYRPDQPGADAWELHEHCCEKWGRLTWLMCLMNVERESYGSEQRWTRAELECLAYVAMIEGE